MCRACHIRVRNVFDTERVMSVRNVFDTEHVISVRVHMFRRAYFNMSKI
jgi:hypothetical protein